MNKQKITSFSLNTGTLTLITLLLGVGKFTIFPEWSWWIVLCPIWLPLTFALFICLFVSIVMIVAHFSAKGVKDEDPPKNKKK